MSKCANCGAKMTCGCQKRTLPDGKIGCSKCSVVSKIKNARLNKGDAPIINQANLINNNGNSGN